MNVDMAPYEEEKDTKIADKTDYNVFMANQYINSDDPIPVIYYTNAESPLLFYQTRETLADIDKYRNFVRNCVTRFRKSRAYKGYKSYLMSMGMDRCQVNGNIQDGMADIEMHHNFLTIFDITILISQHLLNTVGRCTTFDVISLLAEEHRANTIPIVMLSETAHQLYHDNQDFYIPISMTFGKWWELLFKYRYGITLDIAQKVVNYIQKCQSNNELNTLEFYRLASDIQRWGDYNEYQYYNNGYCNSYVYYDDGHISAPFLELNSYSEGSSQDVRDQNGRGQVYTEAQLFG